MKNKKLFDDRANFALDYSHILKTGAHIEEIQVIPLRIEGDDYEHDPPDPNAYGVYFRYTWKAVEQQNLNPLEWIADFDLLQTANAFKSLVYALLVANMDDEDVNALPYKLEAGWAAK